jgi:hypothetical protein
MSAVKDLEILLRYTYILCIISEGRGCTFFQYIMNMSHKVASILAKSFKLRMMLSKAVLEYYN